MTFTGHGTDTDGTIAAYEWSSSINGVFGNTASFSTSSLSEGTHTISFRVQDDDGAWSSSVTQSLTVGTPPPPPVEYIIDNRDPQTSRTGTWSASGATGAYGPDSLWSRDGATFTWIFTPQASGHFEVFMWWTQFTSRSTSIPVRITHGGGTSTVTINQRLNGGQWNSLGAYDFTAGTSYNVTITSQPAPSSTCADAVRFNLLSSNASPTAVIDSIGPNPAEVGQTVTFTGHGTDTDGTIASFQWTSSVSGVLSAQASFTTASLTAGSHTISFRVQDDDGAWSSPVTQVLSVVANTPPTAAIDSITPSPALPGQSVTFTGHGTDTDGTIAAYEWSSSINGVFGNTASFSTSSLSEGTHTISFRVQDDDGAWSSSVTQSLTVGTPPPPPVEYIIDNRDPQTSRTGTWSASGATGAYGPDSLWSRDGATFTWIFTPQASGHFEVFMWWTQFTSRSTSIPVRITHGGGTSTVTINQRLNGGQWNSLGAYDFTAGTSYNVTITSQPAPSSTCADAVRFFGTQMNPPTPGFSADRLWGGAPLSVQFTDQSLGVVTDWLWNFGDSTTSAERNPSHTYLVPGDYTVSLTVTNGVGSNNETKNQYIHVRNNVENIYLCDGFAHDALFIPHAGELLRDMGAAQQGDVWVYENPSRNMTYFVHTVKTPEAMSGALKEEGAHVIFNGHANFGLGATFATIEEVGRQQIDTIRYIDDDRFTNFSSDMVSVKVDGVKYGQAYPNWEPVFKDGTSGVMPFTFTEGLPPYNYYLTYKIPGDTTEYMVELADGRYLQRFPDASTPAWFSETGDPPDPILNSEYFITNPDPDFNRCNFVGNWPMGSVPGAGYMGDAGYLGYNYQYNEPGTGSEKAIWTLLVKYPGVYAVLASWYPSPTHASNAKYTINHSGGANTVEVNQRQTELVNLLGAYYFVPGIYTVELSDDADGRVIADAVILNAVDNPAKILQAEFGINTNAGSAPLAVQFRDLSAFYAPSDTTGSITGWLWDFGDGTSSTTQHPSHTYSTPGVYTVSLRITDNTGAMDTEVKTGLIAVGQAPPLKAQFTSATRLGSDRTVVEFTDQSSGTLTSWSWDFGDGGTSTEQNPTHVYTVPGTYTVTLTVTDNGGTDTETESDFVYNIIGLIYADNTAQHKPHYYSRSAGSPITFGKTILNAKGVKIPDADLKYSRMFYGSCNSCQYYVGTFHRGNMFCTTGDSDSYTALNYLEDYLLGYDDASILAHINSIQPIHEYFDFNLRPPSMR